LENPHDTRIKRFCSLKTRLEAVVATVERHLLLGNSSPITPVCQRVTSPGLESHAEWGQEGEDERQVLSVRPWSQHGPYPPGNARCAEVPQRHTTTAPKPGPPGPKQPDAKNKSSGSKTIRRLQGPPQDGVPLKPKGKPTRKTTWVCAAVRPIIDQTKGHRAC
jgi:hypothetical protein